MQQPFQCVGDQRIVRIERCEEHSFGEGEGLILGDVLAAIRLEKISDPQRPVVGPLGNQVAGAVCGTVVADDPFKAAEGLEAQRPVHIAEQIAPIVRGGEYREDYFGIRTHAAASTASLGGAPEACQSPLRILRRSTRAGWSSRPANTPSAAVRSHGEAPVLSAASRPTDTASDSVFFIPETRRWRASTP